MDNAKVWLPILAIIFAVGGLFLYRHLDLVDKANNELLTTRAVLDNTRETVAFRKSAYEQQRSKTEAAALKVREAQSRLEAAKKVMEEAGKKERAVGGDLKYLASSMPEAVQKAKSDATGTALGDVTLADGKVLRGVTIRKLEESGVSFIHSEGFSTVPLSNLPKSLIEQYDLGSDSIVSQLTALVEKSKDALPAKASAAAASMPAASTSPSVAASGTSKPAVDEVKLKSLRLKVVEIENRIKAAESTASAYERQSANEYTNGDIAKSRGTPSSRYWTAAQQAAQQAQAFKAQAQALEAEKKKLEVEIEFVLRGSK